MEIIAAFVAGALLGAGSLITWALCAANTMYEEKLKKVKTNEDMLKLADSEQLRKALKRMCWKTTNAELVPDIMRAERQGRGNAPVPDFARCIYCTGKEECRRNCTRKLCRKAHLLQRPGKGCKAAVCTDFRH